MAIRTATLTTHYELCGEAGRPVVMLSHSLASGMSMWDPQLPALQHRYRILRYDTRGHGGSEVPQPPYRLEDLVADAVALLDALEIAAVHFVGLSMGGMIGQGLALSHPDRLQSLSLCSTSAQMPAAAQPAIQERIDTARTGGMQALVEGTLARWFSPAFLQAGDPAVERVRRQILATPVEGYIGCTEAIRGLNYLDRLVRVRIPCLVMVGEEDPGTPLSASQAIHARIAGSRLVVLPAVRHLTNIERAEEFNRHLADFLERATEPRDAGAQV
jgi:3-oxoadipate enol-lactonase